MNSLMSAFLNQVANGDIVLATAVVLPLGCAGYWLARLFGFLSPSNWVDTLARLAWQMAIVLGLEQAYEFSRGRIAARTDIAFPNAYRVLDLEWRHHLFVEQRIEHFFLHFRMAMNLVDLFYVVAHVAVTIGVLVYLYVRRYEHFCFARNLLMVTTGLALISFYLFPTAPPRMFYNYGFVDPAQFHNFVSWGGAQPDSYTYNPYAAMPSVHVAYALIVSWALFLAERRVIVRFMALVYPGVMAAAVIISGNHWVLDVVGAFATVAVAGILVSAARVIKGLVRRRFLLLPSFPALAGYESK
ncbi:MAG: hypothetical protein NVS4B2_24140 [Chloroflexota bacterium]